jgi:pre-mRNA-splicing factor CWC22
LELFNENLLRGKVLLARAIMKAQMASPNFTHVYAALIAVLNTKLPDLVRLIINRVMIQFQRAYKRNNKIVCMATTRMIAHMVNQ